MAYTSIADLRTARNNALNACDWWLTPDNPNLDEGLELSRLSYRDELRRLPAKVKVDESNNPVLNTNGHLQDEEDTSIELPTSPG